MANDSVGQHDANGQVVRAFWHGGPLNPFQRLCLRSFVHQGHRVEIFAYDPDIACPAGVVLRDASEIWPTDHVLVYKSGPAAGNPALHSNLFRYAMLHRHGGWWVDLDVVLGARGLPQEQFFFARESNNLIGAGVIKFPAGHPLFAEAIERCVTIGESAEWSEPGPKLFTALLVKHGLADLAQSKETCYPVHWSQVLDLFDPGKCRELKERCAVSHFVHLSNEIWRRCGIPYKLGPPVNSFLDFLFADCDDTAGFAQRMEFSEVKCWVTHYLEYATLQGHYNGLVAHKTVIEKELQALRSEFECLKEKLCQFEKSPG